MTVVIDAGVVVALIVADERQDAARAHLESWLDADEALHAPAVLPYEIANVLARLVFDGAVEISEVDGPLARNASDHGLPVRLVS